MAITTRSGKVFEGVAPSSDVELGNGTKASLFEGANDPEVKGDTVVDEEGNFFGNPGSDGNVKVGGD